jgi:hypothetical protein
VPGLSRIRANGGSESHKGSLSTSQGQAALSIRSVQFNSDVCVYAALDPRGGDAFPDPSTIGDSSRGRGPVGNGLSEG